MLTTFAGVAEPFQPPMNKISILLVDDHKLIRESWSFILNSDERFEVIGETSNAEEAVEIAIDKKPRIV